MKLMYLILAIIFRHKKKISPIADAVSEGIKDTFKEMGYLKSLPDKI